MKIAIDCEFNGFGGQLISMALVAENGDEWYQVLTMNGIAIDPWVKEHVVPVLWDEDSFQMPMERKDFRESLHSWLKQYENPTIIADWHSDLVHFFRELAGENHMQSLSYPCKAELLDLDASSNIPHNALEDARGIMRAITK